MFLSLLSLLLYVMPSAAAQLSPDHAKQLEQQLKAAPVRVRDLLSDSRIRYNAAGNLVGTKWHPGRWTWHSTVEVTKVEAKDRFLRIKANRLLLNFNRTTHRFIPVRSGEVEFEIETSSNADGSIDLSREWRKAFLAPDEDYPLEMQPYWKPFIACVRNSNTQECEYYEQKSREADVTNVKTSYTWKPSLPGVYSVGPDVTPPRVRSRVEPTYTDVARYAHVQGTVMLEAIVSKQGSIEITRVIRPLGYGLEENAAEALSGWVFQPAMRMGQPVDVLLTIEVNFHFR